MAPLYVLVLLVALILAVASNYSQRQFLLLSLSVILICLALLLTGLRVPVKNLTFHDNHFRTGTRTITLVTGSH